MTAALAAQCSVLHLMALTSRHDHLLQATEECFALLCSRTWSRGQIILYLEPSSNLHIVIDLNADGSWAVDDHKSRNTPIVLDFNHMPGSIAEVRAFFYSPSAMRFVDESEHDDCLCRAATDWDEDSKLFIYNQNISPVQHWVIKSYSCDKIMFEFWQHLHSCKDSATQFASCCIGFCTLLRMLKIVNRQSSKQTTPIANAEKIRVPCRNATCVCMHLLAYIPISVWFDQGCGVQKGQANCKQIHAAKVLWNLHSIEVDNRFARSHWTDTFTNFLLQQSLW